ncbi:hypothetical protein GCM10025868_20260 [Angustibacter aerolatus]|uniref:GH26 domain-containing protein n=1 Tax=Angustibacter aerolatus TaxID=1162965 RepID=A0ABQ6JGV5_9ACTN|nr:hypothetical protein GCM10025868_20260 [Angustibacter aerolatus]
MDLTVSAGYRVVPLEQWWPGDDAVDVVGVDQHDLGVPGVPTEQPARWRFLMSQDGGFEDVAAFARAHGKPVSVPEWGITNAASSGNGDDAYYVQQMLQPVPPRARGVPGVLGQGGCAGRPRDQPAVAHRLPRRHRAGHHRHPLNARRLWARAPSGAR